MKSEKLEVVRGSGNVFRDLGHKNADADQVKAILAAEIKRRFTVMVSASAVRRAELGLRQRTSLASETRTSGASRLIV
jgi:hypothetical protein